MMITRRRTRMVIAVGIRIRKRKRIMVIAGRNGSETGRIIRTGTGIIIVIIRLIIRIRRR